MVESILENWQKVDAKFARERGQRGLFPEEEEELKKKLKKEKKRRDSNRRPKVFIPSPEADKVKELMSTFEPESPTKKGIREFRKALQELSLQRYPKKAKKAKKKKV